MHTLHAWIFSLSDRTHVIDNARCFRKLIGTFPARERMPERYATFMNNELKKTWRKKWLMSINELTDINLQQISWTNISLENPHWTYIEFISSYFDDLVLSENYVDEIKQGYVSNVEYETIKDWHKKLLDYQSPRRENFDNYMILNDPKWLEIVDIGKHSKFNLSEVISAEEKKLLVKKLNVA